MFRHRSRQALARPVLLSALGALTALALIGCGSGSAATTQPAGSGAAAGDWVLTAGTSPAGALALVDGSPVTLTVKGSTVSGRAACNSYSGAVSAAGTGFRPGSIAITEMGCPDPAVSTLERRYLAAFAAVRTASIGNDRLVLSGDGVELTFGRPAPTG